MARFFSENEYAKNLRSLNASRRGRVICSWTDDASLPKSVRRAGRHFGRSNRMALQRSSVTMSRGPAPNEGHRSSFYVLYSSACWFAGRAGKARPRSVDPIRREKSYGPDQELDTGAGCSHASSACRQGGTLYDFEHIQSFFRRIFHHPGLSKRCS